MLPKSLISDLTWVIGSVYYIPWALLCDVIFDKHHIVPQLCLCNIFTLSCHFVIVIGSGIVVHLRNIPDVVATYDCELRSEFVVPVKLCDTINTYVVPSGKCITIYYKVSWPVNRQNIRFRRKFWHSHRYQPLQLWTINSRKRSHTALIVMN